MLRWLKLISLASLKLHANFPEQLESCHRQIRFMANWYWLSISINYIYHWWWGIFTWALNSRFSNKLDKAYHYIIFTCLVLVCQWIYRYTKVWNSYTNFSSYLPYLFNIYCGLDFIIWNDSVENFSCIKRTTSSVYLQFHELRIVQICTRLCFNKENT